MQYFLISYCCAIFPYFILLWNISTTSHNEFYRTVPLGKLGNSEDLEGGDSVVSLLRQLAASENKQEGSIGDVLSSNKASDATSDSSEEKQPSSAMAEVSVLRVLWAREFINCNST